MMLNPNTMRFHLMLDAGVKHDLTSDGGGESTKKIRAGGGKSDEDGGGGEKTVDVRDSEIAMEKYREIIHEATGERHVGSIIFAFEKAANVCNLCKDWDESSEDMNWYADFMVNLFPAPTSICNEEHGPLLDGLPFGDAHELGKKKRMEWNKNLSLLTKYRISSTVFPGCLHACVPHDRDHVTTVVRGFFCMIRDPCMYRVITKVFKNIFIHRLDAVYLPVTVNCSFWMDMDLDDAGSLTTTRPNHQLVVVFESVDRTIRFTIFDPNNYSYTSFGISLGLALLYRRTFEEFSEERWETWIQELWGGHTLSASYKHYKTICDDGSIIGKKRHYMVCDIWRRILIDQGIIFVRKPTLRGWNYVSTWPVGGGCCVGVALLQMVVYMVVRSEGEEWRHKFGNAEAHFCSLKRERRDKIIMGLIAYITGTCEGKDRASCAMVRHDSLRGNPGGWRNVLSLMTDLSWVWFTADSDTQFKLLLI